MSRTAKKEITLSSGDMQGLADDIKKSLEKMGLDEPWCVGFHLYFEDKDGKTAKMGGFSEGFEPEDDI